MGTEAVPAIADAEHKVGEPTVDNEILQAAARLGGLHIPAPEAAAVSVECAGCSMRRAGR